MTSSCNLDNSFYPLTCSIVCILSSVSIEAIWMGTGTGFATESGKMTGVANGKRVAVSVSDPKSHAHCFTNITQKRTLSARALCYAVLRCDICFVCIERAEKHARESEWIDIVSIIRLLMQSSIFRFYFIVVAVAVVVFVPMQLSQPKPAQYYYYFLSCSLFFSRQLSRMLLVWSRTRQKRPKIVSGPLHFAQQRYGGHNFSHRSCVIAKNRNDWQCVLLTTVSSFLYSIRSFPFA